jgi:hypothetical protein
VKNKIKEKEIEKSEIGIDEIKNDEAISLKHGLSRSDNP